ncbi:MAG: hypothetical protein R2828_31750 [Saprospiraceae bacterium]
MAYSYLFILLTYCLVPTLHAPEKQPHINWKAVFEAVPEKAVASFKLSNREQLVLPMGGKSYHQQGIQRLEGGGWVVSSSAQDQGYLYFTSAEGVLQNVWTIPDKLVLSDSSTSLKYNHPGGFQIVNNILAIGLENTDHRRESYARVILLDISDPMAPRHLSHLDIVRPAEEGKVMTAGAVAIAELEDHYLVIVGNWDSKRLDFYQTSSKDLMNEQTTMSACLGSWSAGEDAKPYQNINVYGNRLDELFLIGMYSQERTADWADLFSLQVKEDASIQCTKIAEKYFSGSRTEPHFVHGSGTYFDSVTQELWFFSIAANPQLGESWCQRWGGI